MSNLSMCPHNSCQRCNKVMRGRATKRTRCLRLGLESTHPYDRPVSRLYWNIWSRSIYCLKRKAPSWLIAEAAVVVALAYCKARLMRVLTITMLAAFHLARPALAANQAEAGTALPHFAREVAAGSGTLGARRAVPLARNKIASALTCGAGIGTLQGAYKGLN